MKRIPRAKSRPGAGSGTPPRILSSVGGVAAEAHDLLEDTSGRTAGGKAVPGRGGARVRAGWRNDARPRPDRVVPGEDVVLAVISAKHLERHVRVYVLGVHGRHG